MVTTYEQLVELARGDRGIVGLVLGGSRGKGFETTTSDYDVLVVVVDERVDEYRRRFDAAIAGLDLGVTSVAEFRAHAAWGSEKAWDRYTFAHVRAVIDKTGEIQTIIDAKGCVPAELRQLFVAQRLDAYINAFYRSVKAHRRRDEVGWRLAAATSIPPLLDALFALEGRVAPFPDYLARELAAHPIARVPADLTERLLRILADGDLPTQQALAREVEALFREAGLGGVFDAWDGEDRWAMTAAFDA